MIDKSAPVWTLLLLLSTLPAAALAQDDGYAAEPAAETRWQQQAPAPDRWRAAEASPRNERGAYPSRPPGSTARTSWRASQPEDEEPAESGDVLRRSRISQGYGIHGQTPRDPAGVQRVWSDAGSARVKTVYDAEGNIVYRKGWDKKTGEEVPLAEPTGGAGGRYQDELGGLDDSYGAPPARAARKPTGRPAGRASGKGKKDFLSEDQDALRRAEAEEREALSRLGQGKDVRDRTPRHHLRHRDVVIREGPTMWSLAMPVWYNTLTGTLSGPAGTGTGTIASDANIKPGVELAIPHWFLGFQPVRHNTTAAGTFTFRGNAFAAGSTLKFDSDIYEGYYRRGLKSWHVLHLDWMVGAKVFDANVRATDPFTGAVGSYSQVLPIPYLGIIGQYELDANLMVKGFAKYSDLSIGSASETMAEGEIALAYDWGSDYEFSKRNQVMLGYRLLMLDVIANGNSANRGQADVEMGGPIAKITAYF